MRAARRPPARIRTGVRERGARPNRGLAIHAVEDIEQTSKLIQGSRHPIRFGERHRDVAAGEVKPTALKAIRQLAAISQVARRPEVDAGITSPLHRIENGDGIRHMRIHADRDLEGAERDRGTGDGDRCGQRRGSV